MIKLPKVVKAFDLYVGSDNHAGRCDSFKLPDHKPLLEALRAGGFARAVKVGIGYDDDWSIEFETAGLELELLKNEDCMPDSTEILIMGSVSMGDTCEEKQLKASFWGQFEEVSVGETKLGELGKTKAVFACVRVQYFLDDVEILFDDSMAQIRRIYGKDVLAKRRKNLGRK